MLPTDSARCFSCASQPRATSTYWADGPGSSSLQAPGNARTQTPGNANSSDRGESAPLDASDSESDCGLHGGEATARPAFRGDPPPTGLGARDAFCIESHLIRCRISLSII